MAIFQIRRILSASSEYPRHHTLLPAPESRSEECSRFSGLSETPNRFHFLRSYFLHRFPRKSPISSLNDSQPHPRTKLELSSLFLSFREISSVHQFTLDRKEKTESNQIYFLYPLRDEINLGKFIRARSKQSYTYRVPNIIQSIV